ncbi:MAG: ABC transporter permease [Chloroflexota bacterium]|nr:ABC transporter permease [Chloroflexota bacterium]
MFKQLFRKHEFIIGLILIGIIIVIGLINPKFLSLANFFSLLRSATIMGIFSMGALIVLISGGIDVSFTGIAIFSMYTTVTILVNQNYEGGMLLPFVISAFLGLILGLINGLIIGVFKLPTMIVTLGTLSLFRGAMLFFVGSDYYNQAELPVAVKEFARASLFTVDTASGKAGLHPTFFILVFLGIVVWYVLKYTMLGRSFYAMGGDRESAERAGFNILRTQLIIYGFVGLISGIGGMIVGSLFRQANPFSIVGSELDVIAAAVLGGASITGGRGSVFGTLLGIILITIVNNSLVLLGIPSEWQKVVVGFFILLGTAIPLAQAHLARERLVRQRIEI